MDVGLTIIEVQSNSVLGEHNRPDGYLAQANPRKYDGRCHHRNQPERRRVDKRMAESLVCVPVIVGQEYNLAPNQRSSSPSEEAVGLLEGVMVYAAVLGVCEENDSNQQHEDEVCDSHGRDRCLKYMSVLDHSGHTRAMLTFPFSTNSFVACAVKAINHTRPLNAQPE